MDQTIMVVVYGNKDKLGPYTQIVALHHNGDGGNGDVNEEFSAVGLNGLPGGNIPVVTRAKFTKTTGNTYPWLHKLVDNAFSSAKKIRKAKKATALNKPTLKLLPHIIRTPRA